MFSKTILKKQKSSYDKEKGNNKRTKVPEVQRFRQNTRHTGRAMHDGHLLPVRSAGSRMEGGVPKMQGRGIVEWKTTVEYED